MFLHGKDGDEVDEEPKYGDVKARLRDKRHNLGADEQWRGCEVHVRTWELFLSTGRRTSQKHQAKEKKVDLPLSGMDRIVPECHHSKD